MNWFDWVLCFVFIALGYWKAIELVNFYAPKLANWVIRKIEGEK